MVSGSLLLSSYDPVITPVVQIRKNENVRKVKEEELEKPHRLLLKRIEEMLVKSFLAVVRKI